MPTDDTRQYIEITPSTDQLDPTPVTTHLRRLHALGWTEPSRIWQSYSPPTVEILLVSIDVEELTYLIGVDDPSVTDGLERILRGVFPASYELTTRTVNDGWPTTILPQEIETTAIEYRARPTRRHDWQLPLTFFGAAFSETTVKLPLGGIAESLVSLPVPAIAQILIQPKADWTSSHQNRQQRLTAGQDTISHQVTNALWGRDPEYSITSAEEQRLEALEKATPAHSFVVNARAVAATGPRDLTDLKTAFDGIDQQHYRIDPEITTDASDTELLADIRHRRVRSNPRSRLRRLAPTTPTPGIVVGAPALGSFCMLGGDSLPERARRALDPTRSERQFTSLPVQADLETYVDDGLELGLPLSQDGDPVDTPLTLPPSLQRLHIAWFGRTGAGKSSSLTNAILANQQATDGADILVDPKGDGMCETYLRAHVAEHGSLENVREKYDTLFAELTNSEGSSLAPSRIAGQFYCEKKVDLTREYGDIETPAKMRGNETHEKAAEDSKEVSDEEFWNALEASGPQLVVESSFVGEVADFIIMGVPDAVLFTDQQPKLIFERKTTSRPESLFKNQRLQAWLYAFMLDSLGFDTDDLQIAILSHERSLPLETGKELQKQVIATYEERQPGDYELIASPQSVLHLSEYSKVDYLEDLNWALGYWQDEREPIPTKKAGKCRACEYNTMCPDSRA